jgi:hypothetical protein
LFLVSLLLYVICVCMLLAILLLNRHVNKVELNYYYYYCCYFTSFLYFVIIILYFRLHVLFRHFYTFQDYICTLRKHLSKYKIQFCKF